MIDFFSKDYETQIEDVFGAVNSGIILCCSVIMSVSTLRWLVTNLGYFHDGV